MRWRHRTQGLLSPDAFMGLAEETGIIKDLSRVVLNESARQLGIWQRAFRPDKPLFVAVNISSSQLLSTELVDDVRALLGREDIINGTLKIEITESLLMENPELSIEILERLKALGVGIACDDFGTGYSALANLRRLPFDMLKIDKSFLEADPEDEKAMIILETIILLAHDLHLTVVGEGIENQEQIGQLAELECDYGQGFLIGEPMTAKQVVETLGGVGIFGPKPAATGFWDRLTGRSAAPEIPARPSPPPKEETVRAETPAPAPDTSVPAPQEEKEIPVPQPVQSSDEAEVIPEPEKLPASPPASPLTNGSGKVVHMKIPVPPEAGTSDTRAEPPETSEPAPPAPPPRPATPPVSFKSMLTLPEPDSMPPMPPPPPRPTEIFGLPPKPQLSASTAIDAAALAKNVKKLIESTEAHENRAAAPLVAHSESDDSAEAATVPPNEEVQNGEEASSAVSENEAASDGDADTQVAEESSDEPEAKLTQVLRKVGRKKTKSSK